jgi:excisionase family DNA binding protein
MELTSCDRNDALADDDAGLLRPDEVRLALKIGSTKFYDLIASGHLKLIKIGRASRITKTSVRSVIEHGAP